MPDGSPLHVFLNGFLAAPDAENVEKEAVKIEALPVVRLLDDLRTPPATNDPSELIMHRFLYRGGVCLLLGPTGVGKSSLLMQMAIHFALGKPLFGITPGTAYRERGMRILLIQAENDEGDLAEMRDGVLAGCELTAAEKAQASSRILVCTVNDRSSDKFALTLDALLTEHGPFDLVMVDPAFAYLGGDSNSQKDVSRFMRELLNPLLHRHQVGMVLAHHTNKPLRGKEKDHWEAGDYAYLGAGSAEWINPARAALALRSIGSDTVFELRAPKRGKRLRWEDDDKQPTVTQFIAHHRDVGVICWRKADPAEIEELMAENKGGRPRKINPAEVLHCIAADEGRSQGTYKDRGSAVLECAPSTVQDLIGLAIRKGWVRFTQEGNRKRYALTEKGRTYASEHPSSHNWHGESPETT
ncbi:MAG TPA: AAA family ATPase [Verrucomicrobiota bacterium]|nr:AAA family ATPase [Verrucomicrobiota bacterium]HNU53118.1 AAA family ATPase [Verrucomicrobiota bacterium]